MTIQDFLDMKANSESYQRVQTENFNQSGAAGNVNLWERHPGPFNPYLADIVTKKGGTHVDSAPC